jgi:hypothetical protein
METQMVTSSLWLLFFVKVLWRFHPQELHVLFVHSPVKMKIGLVWKPSVEKNFIFSFCPGCKLKSLFFVAVRKFKHHRNLYGNILKSKVFFALCIEIFNTHKVPSLLIG